jgi:hypothetical protein
MNWTNSDAVVTMVWKAETGYVLLNRVVGFNNMCYLRHDDYFTNSETNVEVLLEYKIHIVNVT